MKGKAGRPRIPLSNISNRKPEGLTGSPAADGVGDAQLATGGAAKKRLDKKSRGGKNWISGAHLKKGAFTAQADKSGKTVHEFAEEHKGDSGKTGKRARLALTFQKMAKKKG